MAMNKTFYAVCATVALWTLMMVFYWKTFGSVDLDTFSRRPTGRGRDIADHTRPPSVVSGTRHSLVEERWPERQLDFTVPRNGTHTVHYIWCAKDQDVFLFQHYLSVYSAVRLVKPLRVIIHYKSMPVTDNNYNEWYLMLKDEIPGLEHKPLPPEVTCGSRDLLELSLTFLERGGGVVLGRNVIVTRAPSRTTSSLSFHFSGSSDKTEGVVFATGDLPAARKKESVERILNAKPECVSVETYNARSQSAPCVTLNTSRLFPLDVINASSPFAELARWLFYGQRGVMAARPDPANLIPRITHYVRFQSWGLYEELHFNHYLSILSSLYVAGFERVYLHVDSVPRGRWWRDLVRENITLVWLDKPLTVYQNKVKVIHHQSDIARFLLVYKYGGVYQDLNVLWATRIPDSTLAYPAVVAVDWTRGNMPERFNNGVFMARRDNVWVQSVIESSRRYRDDLWSYNSAIVTYRMYELHPRHVLVDRRLQVICHADRTCCPRWLNATHCAITNQRTAATAGQSQPPHWRDGVLSYHVVLVKPHPSLASPDTVKKRTDMFAELARTILVKSGRQHLLT